MTHEEYIRQLKEHPNELADPVEWDAYVKKAENKPSNASDEDWQKQMAAEMPRLKNANKDMTTTPGIREPEQYGGEVKSKAEINRDGLRHELDGKSNTPTANTETQNTSSEPIVIDGTGDEVVGTSKVTEDGLKNSLSDDSEKVVAGKEINKDDDKPGIFKRAINGLKGLGVAVENFGKKGGNPDNLMKTLKSSPNTLKLFAKDSGLSWDDRLNLLSELINQANADATKNAYEGFNGMSLSGAKLSPTQQRLKKYQDNFDDIAIGNFKAENEGTEEQLRRLGKLEAMPGFKYLGSREVEEIAALLPGPLLSPNEFKAKVFGQGMLGNVRILENLEQRYGYKPGELTDRYLDGKSDYSQQIDEEFNQIYSSYQNARTMDTQGSQARQNIQAERANAQNIQQKDIDLAYYGAEKEFKVKQDVVNAQTELNQKIQEINALEAEIRKAGSYEAYVEAYNKFINMAGGISQLTESKNSGGDVRGGAKIKGIVDISGGFQTTSGKIQSTDTWKAQNQGNADKTATKWASEYQIIQADMIRDLEAAKKGYQERINELNEFSKKLPSDVSMTDPISDYVNGKRGPRDINYYSNMAQGWA